MFRQTNKQTDMHFSGDEENFMYYFLNKAILPHQIWYCDFIYCQLHALVGRGGGVSFFRRAFECPME